MRLFVWRQGLNRVAHRVAVPGPRGAEATLGAPENPLGQPPATEDYRRKPGCRTKKPHSNHEKPELLRNQHFKPLAVYVQNLDFCVLF